MRFYPVPFSAKEEEKLVFNLSVREVLIMSVGIATGLLFAKITSVFLNTFFIHCIPLGLPFVGVAALLAFVKVNKGGCVMTLENFALRKIYFQQKSRHYIKERQV
ncbi:MAG: PrgI family protein [Crenarchaeota archaeon]|mgnify:CR=1 FL=1|nr:PrgI family protein [Thermoproteota archaeon]